MTDELDKEDIIIITDDATLTLPEHMFLYSDYPRGSCSKFPCDLCVDVSLVPAIYLIYY